MRVANEATKLEVGGAISVRRSSMKTSRKTFRMQIDSIYSDKVGAAVRELPSNAFDSHKRAKQSRPFFIHCPTLTDPRFYVRDFGIGMTDQVMGDVYIVIGESDKEETNEEVGKWGLGSKSPFAYVDQYNISCYDGETARHYGYGIAEDGVPDLYLMYQEPCDEPRGVQVGFAVEGRDFDAFKRAIQKVSLAYDPGTIESNIPLATLGEKGFEGQGWAAFEDPNLLLGSATRWYARQGCVIYPITAPEVHRPSDYHSKLTYVIDCPIGTIEVTPSRESIEYKPEVVEYLKARIEAVKAEIVEAIEARVKDIASVSEFFDTVEKLKPSYISHTFTHPKTGLTAPVVGAKFPTLFFEPKLVHGRWEFGAPPTISLKKNDLPPKLFIVPDISALYDPSREPDSTAGWSRSEIRRISRFIRAYMESAGLQQAFFICNVTWDEDFRATCFPNRKCVDLPFEELKAAVPNRVAPPKAAMKPPIRGLAIAKAAGEQKPVFEIAGGEENVAWVSSEQYRRQAAALFKIAKRFDVTTLYIAAPSAQPEVTDAGVLHLRDVISNGLAKDGLNFADWHFTKDRLGESSLKDYVQFLVRLNKESPADYDKLAAGKGEFSLLAKMLRRCLVLVEVVKLSDDEKRALDALIVDNDGHAVKPVLPADMEGFGEAVTALANSWNNPTVAFARTLFGFNASNKKYLTRAVKALLSVQAIFPPSEKLR